MQPLIGPFSMSLGHNPIPPTPFNSPIPSSEQTQTSEHTPSLSPDSVLHVTQTQNSNLQNPPIVSDQHANTTHLNSTLRWERIEGLGHVMIMGELRENSGSSSSTDSNSSTVARFNLDKLNENQLERLCRHAWGGSQTLIEPVVHGVNRDRLHFDFRGSSLGLGTGGSHSMGQNLIRAQPWLALCGIQPRPVLFAWTLDWTILLA